MAVGAASLGGRKKILPVGANRLVSGRTFFLPEEYEPLWGHSCPDEFLRLAAEVDASGVWLFHHRPGRADSDMDGIVERYRPAAVSEGIQLHAAREGVEISL